MNKDQVKDEHRNALLKLSKYWFPEPPKGFSAKVCSQVYEIVRSSSDATIFKVLLETRFFQNFLWKFFHKDITNNHIELVILCALYDGKYACSSLLDYMARDERNLEDLVERLLAITIDLRSDTNFQLHSRVISFISFLSTHGLKHSSVERVISGLFDITIWTNLPNYELLLEEKGHTDFISDKSSGNALKQGKPKKTEDVIQYLRHKWVYTITMTLMELIKSNSLKESPEFISYQSSWINLLFTWLGQPKTRRFMKPFLQALNVTSIFMRSTKVVQEYVKVLEYYMDYPIDDSSGKQHTSFTEDDRLFQLQKVLFSDYKDKNKLVNSLMTAPSIFNITQTDVTKAFYSLLSDEIFDIAKKMGLVNYMPSSMQETGILTEILTDHVFSSKLSRPTFLENFVSYNADVIFSLLENVPIDNIFESLPVPQLKNSQYLSLEDFVARGKMRLNCEILLKVKTHITLVLDRLKISVGKNTTLNVKGSSKYSTDIKNIRHIGNSKAEIFFNNRRELQSVLQDSQYVALITIIKPNQYSPHERLRVYGLDNLQIFPVISSGANSLVVLLIDGAPASDLNYMIALPDMSFNSKMIEFFEYFSTHCTPKLPDFMDELFIGTGSPDTAFFDNQSNRPKSIRILNFDLKNLSSEYNVKIDSQKRIAGGSTSNIVSSKSFQLDYEDDNIIARPLDIYPPTKEVCNEFVLILYSCLNTGFTLVDRAPHTDVGLLEALLIHLQLNYPNERSVVVVPNDLYLSQIKANYDSEIIVYDEENKNATQIEHIYKQIDSLLSQVKGLSILLGLNEYGYDESCWNALLLKKKVQDKWNAYIEKLRVDSSSYVNYPFKEFSSIEWTGLQEQDIHLVRDSYFNISQLFEILERLQPYEKLKHLASQCLSYGIHGGAKTIYTTGMSLLKHEIYKEAFNSIIMVDESDEVMSVLPAMNNKSIKRYVSIGDWSLNGCRWNYLDTKMIKLRKSLCLKHLVPIYNHLYDNELISDTDYPPEGGLQKLCQIVPTGKKLTQNVCVEDAEYCVAMYSYLRSTGCAHSKIAILVPNRYQQALMFEVAAAKAQAYEKPFVQVQRCSPVDHLIVSLAVDLRELSCARKSIYIFGELQVPGVSLKKLRIRNKTIKSAGDLFAASEK